MSAIGKTIGRVFASIVVPFRKKKATPDWNSSRAFWNRDNEIFNPRYFNGAVWNITTSANADTTEKCCGGCNNGCWS